MGKEKRPPAQPVEGSCSLLAEQEEFLIPSASFWIHEKNILLHN
jgi:hypothetical protein